MPQPIPLARDRPDEDGQPTRRGRQEMALRQDVGRASKRGLVLQARICNPSTCQPTNACLYEGRFICSLQRSWPDMPWPSILTSLFAEPRCALTAQLVKPGAGWHWITSSSCRPSLLFSPALFCASSSFSVSRSPLPAYASLPVGICALHSHWDGRSKVSTDYEVVLALRFFASASC